MPEYLAPGVFVEETSFRTKSIAGVSTSTAGFIGTCRFGPLEGPPQLVTSYEGFRRVFGGADDLVYTNATETETNYMARAVRAFFENGGKRVYIARIFRTGGVGNANGVATSALAGVGTVAVNARYPGRMGNVRVRMVVRRERQALVGGRLQGLRDGDTVQFGVGDADQAGLIESTAGFPAVGDISYVRTNDLGVLVIDDPADPGGVPLNLAVADRFVQRLSIEVWINYDPRLPTRPDVRDLSAHPASGRWIGTILRPDAPDTSVPIAWNDSGVGSPATAAQLMDALRPVGDVVVEVTLSGGNDGRPPDLIGTWRGTGSDDTATGLNALAEESDISLVAAPGAAAREAAVVPQIHNALVTHCENLRYRFAILSPPAGTEVSGVGSISDFRSQYDSTRAALYYPWVTVPDDRPSAALTPGATMNLPPDGFIAGIYARTDVERGVWKAPANEVVRGALGFERHLTRRVQEVLNPEGINCLRSFEGRGHRVWGARTISSDPEWTYVSVRRLFLFLERSIDEATQWAVFEPNNQMLWLKVRTAVESFLANQWRDGALMGARPEEAFFVRCDRTTMTQYDLDQGRLICLIGVAPVRPAEFVIFRIGQWTADASVV